MEMTELKGGKSVKAWELIEKIEAYNFEQEGGFLKNCIEWRQLKELNTHIHQGPDDICKICGHNIRHEIHSFSDLKFSNKCENGTKIPDGGCFGCEESYLCA